MFTQVRDNLHMIGRIFKRDILRLVHNRVALIILAGACLLPSLYAWYVIEVNWDPYANTENILIAVANNDAGANSEPIGKLDIGSEVVAKLKENTSIGWRFVDEKEAVDGVYSGKYYGAFVIPSTFSADFISVFSGKFKQPELTYYVNEKYSTVAVKVVDTAATTVQKSINESFVSTVAENITTITQHLGGQLETETAETNGYLTSAVSQAKATVDNTTQALDGLSPVIASSRTSVDSAGAQLGAFQSELPAITNSLNDSTALLQELRTLTQKYGVELSTEVAKSAGALGQASTAISSSIGTIAGRVSQANTITQTALTDAKQANTAMGYLIEQLQNLTPVDPHVQQLIAALQTDNAALASSINTLSQASNQLAASAQAINTASNTINTSIQSEVANIRTNSDAFQTSVLPQISSTLDEFASVTSQLSGIMQSLGPILAQAQSVLTQIESTLDQSDSSISLAKQAMGNISTNLQIALTDLQMLQASQTFQQLKTYLAANPDEIGAFMGSPVKVETTKIYPVSNYGSGVTPFFTNLALWVAGFILMALVKLRVGPEGLPEFTPKQAYFGRWLLYVVLGLIQGLIVCVGDLVLGIQCEHPFAFIMAGLLTVFTYVNLMYALAYAFRHIGKAIAVILLIMQIPGSSGMFPIEMMPDFYQAIHPLLPFTYSIDAMREAIGGFYGFNYAYDMILLALLFVPLGFFVGLVLGKLDFNLVVLFDSKLRQSDLFLTEDAPPTDMRYRKITLLKALLNTDAYRKAVLVRVAKFKRYFPRLTRAGWIALFAQPILTFLLMVLVRADINTKVVLLVIMVAGILLVNTYLIVISYMRADLNYQLSLANKANTDINKTLSSLMSALPPKPKWHVGKHDSKHEKEDDAQ